LPKKLFFGILVILILFGSGLELDGGNFFASAVPVTLNIYLGPSTVLADNSVNNNIFVQIQDTNGAPVRAQTDTTVTLTSSTANVGTVDASVIISRGSTGALARFNSTYTSGSTTITASSSGYASSQAVVTTVGPSPSTLAVYALPPLLPADGNSYSAVMVQLQDLNGAPAKAPIGDVTVTLFSSNTTVGAVDSSVAIASGTTSAVSNIRTAFNVSGQTTITAVATGYVSGQATFTIRRPTSLPSRLQIFSGPPKILADNNISQQMAIALTDSNGTISQTTTDLAVTLALSSPDIGSISSTVNIAAGKTYALFPFIPTNKPGTTSITAVASNLVSDQQSLTTVGSVPSKLAVFGFPPSLAANGQSFTAFVVQLQDNLGNPAKDLSGPTVVNLTSSAPEVGSLVSSTLTIPFGQTQISGLFRTSLVAGSTTITAQKIGYGTGQATLTTFLVDQSPLSLSVSASQTTINAGKSLTISAYVTLADNTPVTGATIQLASNSTGTFLSPVDRGNGTYLCVFTPPSIASTTNIIITVNASKQGYSSSPNRTMQITVTNINALVTANPSTVLAGKSTTITAYVTYADRTTPILGAIVQFSSNLGGTFSTPTETGNGLYTSIFTPPAFSNPATCIITATASSAGGTTIGTTSVTITGIFVSVSASSGTVNLGGSSKISAYVSYADGSPVLGANVGFSSNDTGNFYSVFEEGSGYYSSTFVPQASGTSLIAATAVFSGSSASARTTVRVTGISVSVSASSGTVNLGGSSKISAYVSYADGSPVLGASVYFSSNDTGSFSSVIDQGNGYYLSSFAPPTSPGTYLVVANVGFSGGSISAKTSVHVNGISTTVSVSPSTINDGGSTNVTAYVTYDDQTPVLGANVQFTSNNGGTFSAVVDEGNGYYLSTFTPLRISNTATFTIFAHASLLGSQSDASDQFTDIFNFVQTGTLQLQVEDGNGNLLNQASVVSTSQPTGMVALIGSTDAQGYLVFTGVLPGSYQIQVTKSGFETRTATITVNSSQTVFQTITLSSGTTTSTLQVVEILAAVVIVIVVMTIIVFTVRKRLVKRPNQPQMVQ
jgi:hypothetical protein